MPADPSPTTPLRVLIAGGGVAALEALIALRDLAGERVDLTLLAPEPAFTYGPMATARPFALGHPAEHPLDAVAEDLGAELVRDRILHVMADRHAVRCASGLERPYDALVLAVGARVLPVHHAITIAADDRDLLLHGLLRDLEESYARDVAFVAPWGTSWALPLYEVALLTARDAADAWRKDLRFTLVTPERRPLDLFGDEAAEEAARLLSEAGIEFVGSARAIPGHGTVWIERAGESPRTLPVSRTIALPRLEGPGLAGLPADAQGFVPTDEHGRVPGAADVFAAGDATTFPVKQGGLATQQADAVAEHVAALAGAPVEPAPFRPVLRGRLITGRGDRWLRHEPDDGGRGEAAAHALWWPPDKIAGRYLAPYLLRLAEGPSAPGEDEGHVPVELPLEPPVAQAAGEPGVEMLGSGRTPAAGGRG